MLSAAVVNDVKFYLFFSAILRSRVRYLPHGVGNILSWVILSLPLIQEGQLSVSGERMCTVLVNH